MKRNQRHSSVAVMVVLIICLGASRSVAQKKFTLLRTDWDSAYIDKKPAPWSGRFYIVSKDQTLRLTNISTAYAVTYDPNSKAAIGLGASYGNFVMDLGINASKKQDDPAYATNSVDLQSSLYTGQHVFDINFQWYAGFFASDKDPVADTVQRIFRNDIRTFNLGVNYDYNFGYRRFSFNAPFIGTQIQKKSAGAPLAGIFISYFDLRANYNIIPAAVQDQFNERSQLEEANLLSTGMIGGYAYTFVLPARLFLTLSITPGISFNVGDVKTQTYYSLQHPFTVSPKLISKDALGYGGDKFYALLSISVDRNFVNLGDKTQLNYNLTKLKLVLGYRID